MSTPVQTAGLMPDAPTDAPTDAPPPRTADPRTLPDLLARPHAELRARILGLLRRDTFHIPLEISREDHRRRVLAALQVLADQGIGSLAYPERYGGAADPAAGIAAFETLGFGDTSILVKYGVQFGLWGGSVHQLGTETHHARWLRDIGTLDLPGCYAMTEISHGSNVRELETTATWDGESGEFVVRTPRPEAGKEWIGNAALHGRMATVFAQLRVGDEDHGVHALVVPIRDDAGNPLPGIRIEDNGPKVGLNGVDNGRIWFDGVRIPRDHLLDRFATVTPEGRYESAIESPGRRFFTMLGTLVAGRISIASASVSAAKVGLTVAVRYSDRRRQFGPEEGPEVPILDYPVHQRLLLPRVATTYALHFAVRRLAERYGAAVADQGRTGAPPGDEQREIEAAAAGLKALASWHCGDALQASREAMGGRGYHAANRIGRLRADTDVFATFEGANTVLLQLVAKSLLTRFREEMGDLDFMGIVRFLADRAETRIRERNPVATRRTDPEHLRDPEYHRAAFEYRAERLVESAARRLKHRLDEGMDPFMAFNECQVHLETLGRAHTERVMLDAIHDAVTRAPSPGASEALREIAALFALSRMEAHRAWFLEAGYIEEGKSRAIRAEVGALCAEIRPDAVELVDAWGIPEEVLDARDA
ncbi:MAG TPA: acyl-CoA dehydrogenase [Longimicrobiales bacterium]|nr:acyl-CoA dehydrogenase [Longimicrobiales bacterium]